MLFTSLAFVAFLPLALLAFALTPARARWAVLLATSVVFYGWQRPANLIYLGGVTLAVLVCAAHLARSQTPTVRRGWLAVGVVVVIASLAGFKFYDFAAGEIERLAGVVLPRLGVTAPAGYSFYAFSAVALLVDLHTRRIEPMPLHAGHGALYLAWFPKILAGPIERATTFLPSLHSGLTADPERVKLGLQLMLWGLVKKVLIADNLAPIVDRAFAIPAFATPVDLLLASYCFAFQIYCDFSGYTDIAIGVSLLFGLPLMENFRRPYLARSTAEFWALRWHVSLGRWFRDYLYLPLGGSRAGTLRTYANLMLVFVASGLWHAGLGYGVGWTFLVWGAINGAYQWAGVATRPVWARLGARWPAVGASAPWTLLRMLLTFHLILVSWVFFRAKTLGDATTVLTRIGEAAPDLPALVARYPFGAEQVAALAMIVALMIVEWFDERRSIFQRLAAAPLALRWAVWYGLLAALLLFGRWGQAEFIYMQF